MILLPATPGELVGQIDEVFKVNDGLSLVENLANFAHSFPPSLESFPRGMPREADFPEGEEGEYQFTGPSIIYAWCLALLQELLTRSDITNIGLREEVPAERFIAVVQATTHEELHELVVRAELVEAPTLFTPDVSECVKQTMVYLLYWLNEAAYFQKKPDSGRNPDDDSVKYLDRGDVNLTEILEEHDNGDGWGESPEWK